VVVRSLHECLLLQLQQVSNLDSVSIGIIEEHFEALNP
jgi:DNA-directed RNA polymerase specialized sigma54-like protein